MKTYSRGNIIVNHLIWNRHKQLFCFVLGLLSINLILLIMMEIGPSGVRFGLL